MSSALTVPGPIDLPRFSSVVIGPASATTTNAQVFALLNKATTYNIFKIERKMVNRIFTERSIDQEYKYAIQPCFSSQVDDQIQACFLPQRGCYNLFECHAFDSKYQVMV